VLPSTLPEIFHFSVRDEAVAQRINSVVGKRAAVYTQHVGIPSDCFGETSYFVTEVKVVE